MGKKASSKQNMPITSDAPSASPAAPLKKTRRPSADGKGISHNDIALRAYFIAEKRRCEGLPGDAHSDWLEAERQLRSELKKPKARAAGKTKGTPNGGSDGQ